MEVCSGSSPLWPFSRWQEKPQLESLPLTSEQFSISPPCDVWQWFSTDRALDVNIRPNHSQLALRRLCQPLWWLWRWGTLWRAESNKNNLYCHSVKCLETKKTKKQTRRTDKATIIPHCWLTFHYHIKVVNILSSGVCSCTHVFPPIPLVHCR